MDNENRLYFGGDIHTVDDQLPNPEAVAVSGDTIVAVGSADECKMALGDYEPVDLKGRTLLPGFIDTHMHPMMMIFYDMNSDLRGVPSLGALQSLFRKDAEKKAPGEWLVGLDFDEQDLIEKRLPTRHDLDAACPDRPLLIFKHDGHMGIGNTAAINAAGINADYKNPPGGIIDRETNGFPSGPFRESAMTLLVDAVSFPDTSALASGANSVFTRLASCGLTSVGAIFQTDEEGPGGKSAAMEMLGMIMILDHVPISLFGILIATQLENIEAALQSPLNRKPHKIGAVKIFADGTFASATAFMDKPFTDHPETRGFLTKTKNDIFSRMVLAHNAGLQAAIHSIGDASNRAIIALIDRLQKEFPRKDCRHRLEHGSMLYDDMIADCRRLGIVVSSQPMFMESEKLWLADRIGVKRMAHVYPFKSLFDKGVVLSGSSDAPVESVSVIHAISACVNREGFDQSQRLRADEAIRMYTFNGAYAQFEESEKGSLTPGKRADMVILSENPMKVSPDKIRDIRVLETICGGKMIYQG